MHLLPYPLLSQCTTSCCYSNILVENEIVMPWRKMLTLTEVLCVYVRDIEIKFSKSLTLLQQRDTSSVFHGDACFNKFHYVERLQCKQASYHGDAHTHTSFVQLEKFVRVQNMCLSENESSFQRIDVHDIWISFGNANSIQMNIPTTIDQVLDSHIV